jgi:hypothetical protein
MTPSAARATRSARGAKSLSCSASGVSTRSRIASSNDLPVTRATTSPTTPMPGLLYLNFAPGVWTSSVSFKLATVAASVGAVGSK